MLFHWSFSFGRCNRSNVPLSQYHRGLGNLVPPSGTFFHVTSLSQHPYLKLGLPNEKFLDCHRNVPVWSQVALPSSDILPGPTTYHGWFKKVEIHLPMKQSPILLVNTLEWVKFFNDCAAILGWLEIVSSRDMWEMTQIPVPLNRTITPCVLYSSCPLVLSSVPWRTESGHWCLRLRCQYWSCLSFLISKWR